MVRGCDRWISTNVRCEAVTDKRCSKMVAQYRESTDDGKENYWMPTNN